MLFGLNVACQDNLQTVLRAEKVPTQFPLNDLFTIQENYLSSDNHHHVIGQLFSEQKDGNSLQTAALSVALTVSVTAALTVIWFQTCRESRNNQ